MSAWILTVTCQPAADKAGRPAGSDIPVSEPAAGWPARVRFGGGGANVTQSKRWEENTVCSLGKWWVRPFLTKWGFFLYRRREKKRQMSRCRTWVYWHGLWRGRSRWKDGRASVVPFEIPRFLQVYDWRGNMGNYNWPIFNSDPL